MTSVVLLCGIALGFLTREIVRCLTWLCVVLRKPPRKPPRSIGRPATLASMAYMFRQAYAPESIRERKHPTLSMIQKSGTFDSSNFKKSEPQ